MAKDRYRPRVRVSGQAERRAADARGNISNPLDQAAQLQAHNAKLTPAIVAKRAITVSLANRNTKMADKVSLAKVTIQSREDLD